MKRVFRGLLVFIFLMSSLNICYAKDMKKERRYISESTTVVNHMYDSVKVEKKQYNSPIVNCGQASNLEELKQIIKSAMEEREENISIRFTGYECYDSDDDINIEVIQSVIEEILEEDHYLKYSLEGYNIGVNGFYGDLNLTLRVGYLTTKAQEEYVDRRVKDILSQIITYDMNDYAKERAIHDYIVAHVEYDMSLKEHSAYAALYKGTTVCQGYSLLMYKMLKEIGIESIIVESQPMNHVWNMVYIDDKWYHVDVTWDDPVPDEPNRVLYDYYNLTDFEISLPIKGERHIWDRSEYPRACNHYFPILETKVFPKKDTKINISITNDILFNIKLNENIDMEKVEMFDGENFLSETSDIEDEFAHMIYNGELEEKLYRLKITVEDGRNCFTDVKIQPTLKIEEVDNINKAVRIRSLVDGSVFINNNMAYDIKKGDIITVKKDETISIMPYIISNGMSYNSVKIGA